LVRGFESCCAEMAQMGASPAIDQKVLYAFGLPSLKVKSFKLGATSNLDGWMAPPGCGLILFRDRRGGCDDVTVWLSPHRQNEPAGGTT
jgi:hypothetical protein